MSNILLVWEVIPEESKIYRLLNLDRETYDKIIRCHTWLSNVERTPLDIELTINWLCDWLPTQNEWLISELNTDKEYMLEWLDGYRLVHTGFAL